MSRENAVELGTYVNHIKLKLITNYKPMYLPYIPSKQQLLRKSETSYTIHLKLLGKLPWQGRKMEAKVKPLIITNFSYLGCFYVLPLLQVILFFQGGAVRWDGGR